MGSLKLGNNTTCTSSSSPPPFRRGCCRQRSSLRPRPRLPRCSRLQGGEASPQPFAYEYGVADDYSKANFKKTESQDGNGVVTGSFVIALPDGRIQTTTYTADHVNGFVA